MRRVHAALRAQLATAVVFFAALAPATAAAQTWVPVGPPGGDVRSLAADPRDPRRVYLGTSDGVLYRSEDAGLRWQRLTPGFPLRARSLDEIVVDPRGVVNVGFWEVNGSGGGIARSADGGRTFTMLPGLAGESVRALALAASRPDVMVAGTLNGVFRSADAGRTWHSITPPGHAELRNVGAVAIDPRDSAVVYVGTRHLAWKTLDGGRNWMPVHAGMIDDSDVMTLTVDRRNPQSVFATACSGIYRAQDATGRWTRIQGIPASARRTRAFAQNPDSLDTLYAGTVQGLWMSEDGSATWRQVTRPDLVVNAVLPLPGGTILLGTEGAGVVRSSDGGATWTAANTGFSERFVSRIAFDRAGKRMLVGVWGDRNHGGVFSFRPGGAWERIGAGLEGREVISLAVAGERVLAGTDDGVFLWPAAEGRWARMPTVIQGIDAHPRVNDVAAVSDAVYLAASGDGVLRTTDGGRTWARPALGPWGQILALAVSPRQPGLVLAVAPLGFFKSVDGGDRWVLISRSLGDAQPHAVAFLPGDDRVVFTSTSQGVFRSSDQGRSWVRCGGGVPFTDITALAVHPDGRTIYAGEFTWGGIFRSENAGETWERLPGAGLVTERAWAIAIDPAAPDRVFVASPTGGLHLMVPTAAGLASAGGSP